MNTPNLSPNHQLDTTAEAIKPVSDTLITTKSFIRRTCLTLSTPPFLSDVMAASTDEISLFTSAETQALSTSPLHWEWYSTKGIVSVLTGEAFK